jgi:sulfate adenylyltransferase subunit 1 (EFTu-like GTPase family)
MTKVGSIERYLEDTNKAYAGQSIGITTKDSVYLARGDVICSPGMEPVLTESFIATIFWMGRGNFRKDERLGIRCATQETTCKIEEIKKRINSSTLEVVEENGEILGSLEVGEVIIRTKRPIVIKAFNDVQELGRFVLVQADDVCAGGVII